MEWIDDGIVLSVRPHGESAVIASLLTRANGRHAGLVRGGRGRRLRGVLQIGNGVRVSWRGRLAEHLGALTCEPTRAVAAACMADGGRLAALTSACAVVDTALPEREPMPGVYSGLADLLDGLASRADWAAAYVRWELDLLADLGFGLDIREPAARRHNDPPRWVSAETARVVAPSEGGFAGEPLLVLPGFLFAADAAPPPDPAEIAAGLALTGHFLSRHVYATWQRDLPAARRRLAARFIGGHAGAGS